MAGVEAPAHGVRALGLDAEHKAFRVKRLDGGRETRGEAAAADRDDDGIEIGRVGHELEADGRRAARGVGAFEGMHEGHAVLARDAGSLVENSLAGRLQDHLRALRARKRDAEGVRRRLHDDLGRDAELPRRPGDGDGVIARARGRQPLGAVGWIERKRDRDRPARLECAGALEELELHDDARLGSEQASDRRPWPLRGGRAYDMRRDFPVGLPHLVEGRDGDHLVAHEAPSE